MTKSKTQSIDSRMRGRSGSLQRSRSTTTMKIDDGNTLVNNPENTILRELRRCVEQLKKKNMYLRQQLERRTSNSSISSMERESREISYNSSAGVISGSIQEAEQLKKNREHTKSSSQKQKDTPKTKCTKNSWKEKLKAVCGSTIKAKENQEHTLLERYEEYRECIGFFGDRHSEERIVDSCWTVARGTQSEDRVVTCLVDDGGSAKRCGGGEVAEDVGHKPVDVPMGLPCEIKIWNLDMAEQRREEQEHRNSTMATSNMKMDERVHSIYNRYTKMGEISRGIYNKAMVRSNDWFIVRMLKHRVLFVIWTSVWSKLVVLSKVWSWWKTTEVNRLYFLEYWEMVAIFGTMVSFGDKIHQVILLSGLVVVLVRKCSFYDCIGKRRNVDDLKHCGREECMSTGPKNMSYDLEWKDNIEITVCWMDASHWFEYSSYNETIHYSFENDGGVAYVSVTLEIAYLSRTSKDDVENISREEDSHTQYIVDGKNDIWLYQTNLDCCKQVECVSDLIQELKWEDNIMVKVCWMGAKSKEPGVPEHLVADNETQLVSDEIKYTCEEFGIKHTYTSADNSQRNGEAEIFVNNLKQELNKLNGDGNTTDTMRNQLISCSILNTSLDGVTPAADKYIGYCWSKISSLIPKGEEEGVNADKYKIQADESATIRHYEIMVEWFVEIYKNNKWFWRTRIRMLKIRMKWIRSYNRNITVKIRICKWILQSNILSIGFGIIDRGSIWLIAIVYHCLMHETSVTRDLDEETANISSIVYGEGVVYRNDYDIHVNVQRHLGYLFVPSIMPVYKRRPTRVIWRVEESQEVLRN
ncbi:unnamed protein product [Caenorhabditis angaria]|uniref:Integrase catalytic domain-containing protein n=1 Tax=Caenorhabditis angaria TaxID=860376 RepID=A0A9P1I3C7_9PELO|nr:unnamed protein product [Caenorhabditis angaria]